MKGSWLKFHPIGIAIAVSAVVLLGCSSARHWLFQSNALDLGWFDQAIYLISQGQTPIVSFASFHILGDHAALIVYPLALLYKIYPSVYWLLAVQALALALGALPTWQLARQAGLKDEQAMAMAAVYLLYPLVFNVNLFDFHPEVIALPAILWAVLAARLQHLGGFCLAIAVILSCKAVLSLTVAAMGLWLLLFEKKRLYGVIALVAGVAWFAIATQGIIPYFSGKEVSAVARYDFLGKSVSEILKNLLFNPGLVLSRIFTAANLEYLVLLFVPVIWGLSPRHLTPLIPAIPALGLNLLTDYQPQKDLTHQYSLPILPFLLLAVMATLADGKGWLRQRRYIIIGVSIAFIALAKYGYFGSRYLEQLGTWQAMREGVALIPAQARVLTAAQIAPHLTHRPILQLAIAGTDPIDINQFDYVLLNQRYPGWENSQELVDGLLEQLKQTPTFRLRYERDGVFVFLRAEKVGFFNPDGYSLDCRGGSIVLLER